MTVVVIPDAQTFYVLGTAGACCSKPRFCISIMACFCIKGTVVQGVIACQYMDSVSHAGGALELGRSCHKFVHT